MAANLIRAWRTGSSVGLTNLNPEPQSLKPPCCLDAGPPRCAIHPKLGCSQMRYTGTPDQLACCVVSPGHELQPLELAH